MRTVALLATVLGLALTATLARSQPQAVATPPAGPAALGAHKQILAPLAYKNLTLVPVVSTAPVPASGYLVLDEGMKSGKVAVIETADGGTVNELVLENRSSEPLFLLAGEVVIGGKQDRIIGKDTVIPPRTTQKIPVFCVEHGRWSGRKADFSTAQTLAHTALRKKAKYGTQSEVWQEVSSKNAKRRVQNDTQTYRRVAMDPAVEGSIADYEAHFSRALASLAPRRDLVGFVVALNGEVVAIETFGSPALFRKLEHKLLRSYYVEAVDGPHQPGAAPAPSAAAIRDFRDKAARAKQARARTVLEGKRARTVQFDDAELQGSTVAAPGAAEPVYDSVFKK